MARRIGLCPMAALLLLVAQDVLTAPLEQHAELEPYYPDNTGCYYNFQHYEEGDRIITNEPCLNCTCHNRMLMCYLRVCPFTKAIGQDCKVEKRPDQCCPVITCPEVPVQLLTSTTTESSTEVGHMDNYGCSIDNTFYPDGARVPSNPYKPCELCYCIRNRTACVMQECTLHVEGCKPVYEEGVCCPVRYACDYPEEPLSITTLRPTTGLLLTTTLPPGASTDCVFNNEIYADGASIRRPDKPCEHCYCMRAEIVCAVQECGPTPLDKVAQNCTALAPRQGQCCPDTYECNNRTTQEELTTVPAIETTTLLPDKVEPVVADDDNVIHDEHVPDVTTLEPIQPVTQSQDSENIIPEVDDHKKPEEEQPTEVPHMPTEAATEADVEKDTDVAFDGPADGGEPTEDEHLPSVVPGEETAPIVTTSSPHDEDEVTKEVEHAVVTEAAVPAEGSTVDTEQRFSEHATEEPVQITTGLPETDEKPVDTYSEESVTEISAGTEAPEKDVHEAHVTDEIPTAKPDDSSVTAKPTEAQESVTDHEDRVTEEVPIHDDKPAVDDDETPLVTKEPDVEEPHVTESVPAVDEKPVGGEHPVTDEEETPDVTTPEKVEPVEEHVTDGYQPSSEKPQDADQVKEEITEVVPTTHVPDVHADEQVTEVVAPVDAKPEDGVQVTEEVPVTGMPEIITTPIEDVDDEKVPAADGKPEDGEHDEDDDKKVVTEKDEVVTDKPDHPVDHDYATTLSSKPEASTSVDGALPDGVSSTAVPEQETTEAVTDAGEDHSPLPVDEVPDKQTAIKDQTTEAAVVTAKPQEEPTTDETVTSVPPASDGKPEEQEGQEPVTEGKLEVTTEEQEKITESSTAAEIKPHEEPTEDVVTDGVSATEKPTESPHVDEEVSVADDVAGSGEGHVEPEVSEATPSTDKPVPVDVTDTPTTEAAPSDDHKPEEVSPVESDVTTEASTDKEPVTEKTEIVTPTEEKVTVVTPIATDEHTEGEGQVTEVVQHLTSEKPFDSDAYTTKQPEEVTHPEHVTDVHPVKDDEEEDLASSVSTTPAEEEHPDIVTEEAPVHDEKPVVDENVVPEEPLPATDAPAVITEGPEILTEEPAVQTTERGVEPEYTTEYDEDKPGIPGEGNCLLEGQTYVNNSNVPPMSQCFLSCVCISSMIQCQRVACSPAPSNMRNCMPVFHGPDSCCPSYSCTDAGTPQVVESDSHQMQTTSGAETTTEYIKQDVDHDAEVGGDDVAADLPGGDEHDDEDEDHVPKEPTATQPPSVIVTEERTSEAPVTTSRPAEDKYDVVTEHKLEVEPVVVDEDEKDHVPVTDVPEDERTEVVPEKPVESTSQKHEHTEGPHTEATPASDDKPVSDDLTTVLPTSRPHDDVTVGTLDEHTTPSVTEEPVVTDKPEASTPAVDGEVPSADDKPDEAENEVGGKPDEDAHVDKVTTSPEIVVTPTESVVSGEGTTEKEAIKPEITTTSDEIVPVTLPVSDEKEEIPVDHVASSEKPEEATTVRVEVTDSPVEEDKTQEPQQIPDVAVTTDKSEEGTKAPVEEDLPAFDDTPQVIVEEHPGEDVATTDKPVKEPHVDESVTESQPSVDADKNVTESTVTSEKPQEEVEEPGHVTEVAPPSDSKPEEPEYQPTETTEKQEDVTSHPITPEVIVTEAAAPPQPDVVTQVEEEVTDAVPASDFKPDEASHDVTTEGVSSTALPEAVTQAEEHKTDSSAAIDEVMTTESVFIVTASSGTVDETTKIDESSSESTPSADVKPIEDGRVTEKAPEVVQVTGEPDITTSAEHVTDHAPTTESKLDEEHKDVTEPSGDSDKPEVEPVADDKPDVADDETDVNVDESSYGVTSPGKPEGVTESEEQVTEHIVVPQEQPDSGEQVHEVPIETVAATAEPAESGITEKPTTEHVAIGQTEPVIVDDSQLTEKPETPIHDDESSETAPSVDEKTEKQPEVTESIAITQEPEVVSSTSESTKPDVDEEEDKKPVDDVEIVTSTSKPESVTQAEEVVTDGIVHDDEKPTDYDQTVSPVGLTEKPDEKETGTSSTEPEPHDHTTPESMVTEKHPEIVTDAKPEEEVTAGVVVTVTPGIIHADEQVTDVIEKETDKPVEDVIETETDKPVEDVIEKETEKPEIEGVEKETEKPVMELHPEVTESSPSTAVPEDVTHVDVVTTPRPVFDDGKPEDEQHAPEVSQTTEKPELDVEHTPVSVSTSDDRIEDGEKTTESSLVTDKPEVVTQAEEKVTEGVTVGDKLEEITEPASATEKFDETTKHSIISAIPDHDEKPQDETHAEDHSSESPDDGEDAKTEDHGVAGEVTDGPTDEVTTAGKPDYVTDSASPSASEVTDKPEHITTETPVKEPFTGKPQGVVADDEDGEHKPEKPSTDTQSPEEVPAVTTSQPISITTEESEKATEEPEKGAEDAEKTSEEPEKATKEPEKATEEPEKASEEPEKVTEEPEKVSEVPEKVSEEPEKVTEEPERVTEEVTTDGEIPSGLFTEGTPAETPAETPDEIPNRLKPGEDDAASTTAVPEDVSSPDATTSKPVDDETIVTSKPHKEVSGEEPYTSPPEDTQTVRTTPVSRPGELSTSAPTATQSTVHTITTTMKPTELPDIITTLLTTQEASSTTAAVPSTSTEGVSEETDYGTSTDENDYEDEEHGSFGPGTCRYGGKIYVSAQQIPRDDPCDFCFCFRGDIICLQQSCPPPIPRCHEESIHGFCCPRYECPVSMATSVNITTSTTTTTTTLPPHFLSHAYKGAASRRGCQIQGQAYQVGEVVPSASGPCLHCTCGGDGQMKCDPKACSPEPMLRQMIAAAAASRRR